MNARTGAPKVSSAERITVGLIPKVSRELSELAEETHLSKTDLVNRAISLLKLVSEEQAAGRRLAFVGPNQPNGMPAQAEIVHLL